MTSLKNPPPATFPDQVDHPNLLGAFLQQITIKLAGQSETPSLDAQVLLAAIVNQPQSWVIAHPEYQLSPWQVTELVQAFRQLEAGIPLPYVIGEWAFCGLMFTLTRDVLIPRPETELLVELALDWLKEHPHRRRIAEAGTGSGCIAISLARHVPDLQILASERSWGALQVAAQNAKRHDVSDQIRFVECNLLEPLAFHSFDLILANLPYIPSQTLYGLNVFGREPTIALDGGPDGMSLNRQLLERSPALLRPGGMILLEIEASQGRALLAYARTVFPDADIAIRPDLAGRDRLLQVATEPGTVVSR